MSAVLVTGSYYYAGLAVSSPAVTETRQYSLRLPTEGRPGWVGLDVRHEPKVVTNTGVLRGRLGFF